MKIRNNFINVANLYGTVLFYLLQRQMGVLDIKGTEIFTIVIKRLSTSVRYGACPPGQLCVEFYLRYFSQILGFIRLSILCPVSRASTEDSLKHK